MKKLEKTVILSKQLKNLTSYYNYTCFKKLHLIKALDISKLYALLLAYYEHKENLIDIKKCIFESCYNSVNNTYDIFSPLYERLENVYDAIVDKLEKTMLIF